MRCAALALVLGAATACSFHPSPLRGDGGAPGDTLRADTPGRDGASDAAGGDASGDASTSDARRKPITIQGAKVKGTQNDFPVWIALTDSDLAATARADGQDIFFTDASGAPLDYEIQSWNPAQQQLLAWVRLPTLAMGSNTTIYVEYGDLAKARPHDPRNVWKSQFVAVWHLDDALTSNTVAESTGTAPGTATSLGPNDRAMGQLGSGIEFDGSGQQQIAFTNPISGGTASTISAWVDQNQADHTSAIVMMGDPTNPLTNHSRFLYGQVHGLDQDGAYFGLYNDDVPTNVDIERAGWTMLVWTYEGANKQSHLYRNGVDVNDTMMGGGANTSGTSGLIGFAPEPKYGSPNGMTGVIDEVRIATVARDGNWIATEYANQSSPSTFYTVGPEEAAP